MRHQTINRIAEYLPPLPPEHQAEHPHFDSPGVYDISQHRQALDDAEQVEYIRNHTGFDWLFWAMVAAIGVVSWLCWGAYDF